MECIFTFLSSTKVLFFGWIPQSRSKPITHFVAIQISSIMLVQNYSMLFLSYR